MAGVDDLPRLVRDRPLVTRELHQPSAFYGHAEALNRYSGRPRRTRTNVAIEHGVAFTEHVWRLDAEAPVPTFFCASPRRAKRYAEIASSERVAVPIGPMILYAGAEEECPVSSAERRLVVFPAHSTHHIDAQYDVRRLAERLLSERREWDEVVVCLYWKDVLRGTHREYETRGLRCVTAGHMYDPAFLPRLHDILASATAVTANEVGTSLFYAVAMNRPVWLADDEVDYLAEPDVLRRDRSDPTEWVELTATIRAAFAERRTSVSPEQRTLIDELAGLSKHRSSAEMARLLDEAAERYHERVSRFHRARARGRADIGRGLGMLRRVGWSGREPTSR